MERQRIWLYWRRDRWRLTLNCMCWLLSCNIWAQSTLPWPEIMRYHEMMTDLTSIQLYLRNWNLLPGKVDTSWRILSLICVHDINFLICLSFLPWSREINTKRCPQDDGNHHQPEQRDTEDWQDVREGEDGSSPGSSRTRRLTRRRW